MAGSEIWDCPGRSCWLRGGRLFLLAGTVWPTFLVWPRGGGKHWLVARAALLLLVAAGGGDDSAGRCRAAPLALCGLVGREEEYDERTYGGGMHVEDGAKQETSELG